MLPLEDDEEVKEGKRLKILTPNKLLTAYLVLLAQIKVENNSYKLKNEIRQILLSFVSAKALIKCNESLAENKI